MYDRILVGYVDTDHGADALALGGDLARLTGGGLRLATVVPAVFIEHIGERSGVAVVHGGARERASVALHDAAERVAGVGRLERRLEASSSPAFGLHDLAEAEGADLIVLGASRRTAAGRAFLGSVPERLLHGAPCAVAVAPDGYAGGGERRPVGVVGVGFDGSAEARAALAGAHTLAARAGARLRVLTVLEPLPHVLEHWSPLPGLEDQEAIEWEDAVERQRAAAEAAVAEAVGALGSDPVEVETELLAADDVPGALVEATREGVDLLVLGSRGYGPVHRTLGGSVSTHVLRHASVPVVVAPRHAAG